MKQTLSSEDRVAVHTPGRLNEHIRFMTDQSIEYHAMHPERIGIRLKELRDEWDIERILETNASSLMLTGTFLGVFVNKKWLGLSAAVAGFLLQHAVQGWCPPISILRRIGVRTKEEIERERAALRALRGDFNSLHAARNASHKEKVDAVFAAINE